MNKKFLVGLLSGFTGSLIILSIFIFAFGGQISLANGSKAGVIQEQDGKEDSLNLDIQQIMSKVDLLQKYIDVYYMGEIKKEDISDGIYKGVLASLGDPYSTYYTKEEYQSLTDSSKGKYCGIGSTVSQNMNTGIITIVKPFVNGPAYKAGILPGDILYKVNEEEVTGKDLTSVVGKMKGEEGTEVGISIVREGETEPIEFSVKRATVEVPTIEHEMLKDQIGYIKISEFDDITAEQFRKAIDELEKEGIKGLVIDLRDNGGGVLDAAADMLDRLLPKGLLVYTKDKYDKGKEYYSSDKDSFSKPLAVLINGNSASASELFSGAIQDYKAGTLVGTTSFGKGIVQSVIPLEDGTAIKVTTSKYFTPKGRNIHKVGIEPEVKVELKEELAKKTVISKEEDNQLQKAIETVKEKIGKSS